MTSQALILSVIYHETRSKFKLEINDTFVLLSRKLLMIGISESARDHPLNIVSLEADSSQAARK